MDSISKEIERLEKLNDDFVKKIVGLQDTISELRAEKKALKNEVYSLERECSHQKKITNNTVDENSRLESELRNAQDDLKIQLNAITGSKELLKEKNQQLRKENMVLCDKNEELTDLAYKKQLKIQELADIIHKQSAN